MEVLPTVILDQEVRVVRQLTGKVIYGEPPYNALKDALEYAANGGFVASTADLLRARAKAPILNGGEDSWENWYIPLSETDVGIDLDGKYVNKGGHVVVTSHRAGILASPERLRKAYHEFDYDKLGPLTEDELRDLLHGGLPSGRAIQVFSYNQFLEESRNGNFLERYKRFAVAMPLELAKMEPKGHQYPLLIVCAGGETPAKEHFEYVKRRFGEHASIDIIHPFDGHDFDPQKPQGSLHHLGDDADLYLAGLGDSARFVAVSRVDLKEYETMGKIRTIKL